MRSRFRELTGAPMIHPSFFLMERGTYYLFASWDLCCRGTKSTYRTIIGRAKSITGPYLDKSGVPMMDGGGTELLTGNRRWLFGWRIPAGCTAPAQVSFPPERSSQRATSSRSTRTMRAQANPPCRSLPLPGSMAGRVRPSVIKREASHYCPWLAWSACNPRTAHLCQISGSASILMYTPPTTDLA